LLPKKRIKNGGERFEIV